MKAQRLKKIVELVENNEVCTQEELLQLLEKEKIITTQATISRDIKELNLVKTISDTGKYKYSTVKKTTSQHLEKKYKAVFIESVVSVDYALNTVVIRCHTGMANAACAALDTMNFTGVVGTLAGDDTIFVLMKTELFAEALTLEVKSML